MSNGFGNGFGLMIESLVAILLLLTIAFCVVLNSRLKKLKADEQALKGTIAELITATEIGQADIAVEAVLYEAELPLKQLMQLEVGHTLTLDLKPDALVTVRCGEVTLTEGRMGRVGDRVAVRVVKPLRKPKTTFAMFEMADKTSNRMETP